MAHGGGHDRRGNLCYVAVEISGFLNDLNVSLTPRGLCKLALLSRWLWSVPVSTCLNHCCCAVFPSVVALIALCISWIMMVLRNKLALRFRESCVDTTGKFL